MRGHITHAQLKVMSAIESCRTAALGGHVARCANPSCGHTAIAYSSCRNRHCPKCQGSQARAWMEARQAELLEVPYFHVVFTLPPRIGVIAYQNKAVIYDLLFKASSETLLTIAADPKRLGVKVGFTSVLHTWGSAMTHHPHVHMIVPGGGISADGSRWIGSSEDCLLPVPVLSRMFRGKMLSMLKAAHDAGRLQFFGDHAHLSDKAGFKAWLEPLYQTKWHVHAKRPFAGPEAVLAYLARYTHRTAIGHERILAVRDDGVRLRVRGDGGGRNAGKKTVRIDGAEFVGRFLQHVLPAGFKRIRHYGLLAPAHKTRCLSQARAALAMPVPNPIAQETVAAFMRRVARIEIERCPRCHGCWRPIAHAAPLHTSLWPRAGSTTPQTAAPQTAAQPQAP